MQAVCGNNIKTVRAKSFTNELAIALTLVEVHVSLCTGSEQSPQILWYQSSPHIVSSFEVVNMIYPSFPSQ
jgi:hypothetical protein